LTCIFDELTLFVWYVPLITSNFLGMDVALSVIMKPCQLFFTYCVNNMFLHSLTYLYHYIANECFQTTYRGHLFNYSNLCPLIGKGKQFLFIVLIDMEGFESTFFFWFFSLF
jgi:hypothetical protein